MQPAAHDRAASGGAIAIACAGDNGTMLYEKELFVARQAAVEAGRIALEFQTKGFGIEVKADASPVTDADRACEKAIAALLIEAFPDDGILGEEGATAESRSGRRWIIDPIDGTRDFLRGNRLWATLIGLEEEGTVVAGVAAFPALEETYFAARGMGSFCNDQPIRASAVTDPAQSVFCLNGIQNLGSHPKVLEFASRCWAIRSLGGAPDAMLVCSGKADVWLEPAAKAWDLAPMQVIAEEAGAKFFNLDGGNSIHAGNCVICAPGLVESARASLGGGR